MVRYPKFGGAAGCAPPFFFFRYLRKTGGGIVPSSARANTFQMCYAILVQKSWNQLWKCSICICVIGLYVLGAVRAAFFTKQRNFLPRRSLRLFFQTCFELINNVLAYVEPSLGAPCLDLLMPPVVNSNKHAVSLRPEVNVYYFHQSYHVSPFMSSKTLP